MSWISPRSLRIRSLYPLHANIPLPETITRITLNTILSVFHPTHPNPTFHFLSSIQLPNYTLRFLPNPFSYNLTLQRNSYSHPILNHLQSEYRIPFKTTENSTNPKAAPISAPSFILHYLADYEIIPWIHTWNRFDLRICCRQEWKRGILFLSVPFALEQVPAIAEDDGQQPSDSERRYLHRVLVAGRSRF